MSFAFELTARLYEVFGPHANRLRDRKQIRLVRLEKAQQRGQQMRIGGSAPELVGPDSGQVDESLRPTLAPKRCGKRSKGNGHRIVWYPGRHSLETAAVG